ncbi:MAG TPA: M23 family metallopeptidase, partial [Prochlorococcaceae cyanobacterium Gl_MAG_24]|nr:M23 family metallopeptidase [Prochlorococcaceae cyanobacterium Gl_MAG_24]
MVAITAIALAPLVTVGAVAESLWQSGVFPIVQFEGYSSHFGRRLGISGNEELHTGLDIAAPLGSPVLSWWSGEVVEIIDDSICGLGVVIVPGDYEHIYCHLQQQFLHRGQKVRGGQPIGRVGVTGRTSGPHLHWGIRYRGRWL